MFAKNASLSSLVASMPGLEFMLVNESFIKKLDRVTCTFLEISLFYTATMKQSSYYLLRQIQNLLLEKSSTSISTLLSEFTGYFSLEPSCPLGSCRESVSKLPFHCS